MADTVVYSGTAAQLYNLSFQGFDQSDIIHITDANISTFSSFRGVLDQVSYNDGPNNAYFFNIPSSKGGGVVTALDPNGGVDIRLAAKATAYDFNGDGRSDILWTNVDQRVSVWTNFGGAPDSFSKGTNNTAVPSGWVTAGTFDWNGDGYADIIWRNKNDGAVAIWTGSTLIKNDVNMAAAKAGQQAYVQNLNQSAYLDPSVDQNWQIAGLGDFNGDHKGDVLWRNSNGSVSLWSSTGSGFEKNSFYHDPVKQDWRIAETGDFNGDGKSDILWRNDNGAISIWTSTGSDFQENSFYTDVVPKDGLIAGVGDFNGDGRDDILWETSSGALSVWLSKDGGFVQDQLQATVPEHWVVAAIGDFNGDGRADVLWRNDAGATSIWHSTGSGWQQNTYYDGSVDNGWQITSAHQAFIPAHLI